MNDQIQDLGVRSFDPTKFDVDAPFPLKIEKIEPERTDVIKDEFIVDLSEDYGELEFTLEINGVCAFPKGDLQVIKAKAKQGKTHVILCIMIALLRGCFLNIKTRVSNPKVCYFATEEHKRSVQLLAKKIHKLCDWSTAVANDKFLIYSLRKQTPKERTAYIEMQIQEQKPDMVFIDGIRDLVNDFNNIEESNKIINLLMRLSEENNCAIVNVIHTNKSYSDSNMRGYLGTELLNKSSDVLGVEKRDDVFTVEETDCRNVATGKWAFKLDENGLPHQAEVEPKKSKAEKRIEVMKRHFAEILTGVAPLTFTELRNKYMPIAKVKIDAANKHIGEMVQIDFLKKGDDEKYQLF